MLDLAERKRLPADLRALPEKYPRETWDAHDNLGATARFWLGRHAMFRELGGLLKGDTRDFREGRLDAAAFRRFFAPRLQFFLSSLDGHHRIEDAHYFPLFRAVETRLAHGFDLLERDHEAIDRRIGAVVDAANALMRAGDDAGVRTAAIDDYAAEGDRLRSMLLRHLDDEEDLIVPVILEHGERRLFAAA